MSRNDAPGAPRRRRWILRAILVLVLILILLPIGYWGWGVYQRHLLNEVIAKLHAAGEPVLPEDFNNSSTTDSENPVPELRAAAEMLPHDLDIDESAADEAEMEKWSAVLYAEFPLTATESSTLREIVAAHQAALAHIDAAFHKTGRADWQIRFESPVIRKRLTDLNRQRTVAKLLRLAVMDAHQRGDDAEAIKRVREMLLVSRSLYSCPFLVGHLVAVGDGDMAMDAVEGITPDLRIDTGVAPGRSVSSGEIHLLIAQLLDERDQRAGIEYGLRSERMMQVDSARWAAKGKGDPSHPDTNAESLAAFALGPLAFRDARLLIGLNAQVAAAARAQTWPACDDNLPPFVEMTDWDSRLHPFYSILRPAYRRAMLQDFCAITSRRMHAVALAMRWYSAAHAGNRPAKLEELVPDYLPAVPRDPFATDAPLRYRPGADPVVYSVGENGTDEGGSELPGNPQAYSPGQQVNLWDQQDVTLHLNRRPRERKEQADGQSETQPPTAPTTKPSIKE